MMVQTNEKIVTVVLTVRLTAGNSPGFETQAGDSATGGPGSLPFMSSGVGEANATLLREVLQKLLDAYPKKPISLCLAGRVIGPDELCARRQVVPAELKPISVLEVAAISEAAPRPRAKGTERTKKQKKKSVARRTRKKN